MAENKIIKEFTLTSNTISEAKEDLSLTLYSLRKKWA